jgi:hypothetical protein
MVQVSLTAREHVNRAQRLDHRAEAALRAQSREAALEFTLLTSPWTDAPVRPPNPIVGTSPREAVPENPYAAAWNFRGDPFTVDSNTYKIQDVSGLLSVGPGASQSLVPALEALGVEIGRARSMGLQFERIQGNVQSTPAGADVRDPVLFPLQSLDALRDLEGMTDPLFLRLAPLLTLYPTQGFNPITAPAELLATRLTGSPLQSVLMLREQGALDPNVLYSVAGIQPDDTTTVYPGPAVRIEFVLDYGGVRLHRETTMVVKPYDRKPLSIWSRRDLGTAPPT